MFGLTLTAFMMLYFYNNSPNLFNNKKKIKPTTLKDIAGNKKNIIKIQNIIKKSEKNTNITCILLEGPPGTGKRITAQQY